MEGFMLQWLYDGVQPSDAEASLLEDIRQLWCGEILHVEIPAHTKTVKVYALTLRQAALIDQIRAGTNYFTRIVVEEGEPIEAFCRLTTPGGFEAIRRITL